MNPDGQVYFDREDLLPREDVERLTRALQKQEREEINDYIQRIKEQEKSVPPTHQR